MTTKTKNKYIVSGFVSQLGGQPQEFRREIIARSEKEAISRFGNQIKTRIFKLSYEAKVIVTKPHVKFLYEIK